MRVLVLDDSRAMRTILRGILSEAGFEVLEAASVKDALAVVKQQPELDLALVDWNLPDTEGIEFVRQVRAQRKLDHVKLMMVTTETEMSQVARALEAGADEYVMKPFTKDILIEKLQVVGLSPT